MLANETYQCVIGDCVKVAPTPPPSPEQRMAELVRKHNDALAWLWPLVDVLMPELYISEKVNADFTRGMLREAERIVANTAATTATSDSRRRSHSPRQQAAALEIVPFTWMRFDDNNTRFLDAERLSAEFEVPFEFPHVKSMLVWGDPAVGHVSLQQINAAFADPKTGLRQLIQRVGVRHLPCQPLAS